MLALAALAGACGSQSGGGRVCTDLFAFITAIAVDTSGKPVTGLAVSDTVTRTGHGFDVAQQAYGPDGTVTIFSDSNLGDVRESGDAVRVTGIVGAARFAADYVFGSDGCHVRKVSGPDTVVVR